MVTKRAEHTAGVYSAWKVLPMIMWTGHRFCITPLHAPLNHFFFACAFLFASMCLIAHSSHAALRKGIPVLGGTNGLML